MLDIYMIFMSGFALFGLYCFAEAVLSILTLSEHPPTITIFLNSQDEMTFKKIKYVENYLPNNYNILYPFDETKTDEEQCHILNEFIKSVFIVNKQ